MTNPFQIRADLLQKTTDILTSQYAANMAAYHAMVSANTKTVEELMSIMPKHPTVDEIVAEAQKFYSFVNKK